MAKGDSRAKQLQRNPLTVIAALIGVVEAAFAYPVTRLTGTNQTFIVAFMVLFPALLLLCFFITVWFFPGHLYGPSDYTQDDSFLMGIGRVSALRGSAIKPPPDEPPTSRRRDELEVSRAGRDELENLKLNHRS
jgi:hypothetical protein